MFNESGIQIYIYRALARTDRLRPYINRLYMLLYCLSTFYCFGQCCMREWGTIDAM